MFYSLRIVTTFGITLREDLGIKEDSKHVSLLALASKMSPV
jgi:hypothetical protein